MTPTPKDDTGYTLVRGSFLLFCFFACAWKPFTIAAFHHGPACPATVDSIQVEMEEQVDRLVKKTWGQQTRLSSVQAYKLTILSRQIPATTHLEAPSDSSSRHTGLW